MMKFAMLAALVAILMMSPPSIQAEECITWPPPLPGVVNGTISLSSSDLLKVPEAVISTKEEGEVKEYHPPSVRIYLCPVMPFLREAEHMLEVDSEPYCSPP